jgi:hypothetical protein
MKSSNMNKQELATLVFDDKLKADIENTLKNHYGVKSVNYRLLTYGMGIEISGSDSFNFIRSAVIKVTGLPTETLSIISEDEKNGSAFYAYLPEKDKTINKRIRAQKI